MNEQIRFEDFKDRSEHRSEGEMKEQDQEKEKVGREVSVWVFRHGEPDYEKDSLTEDGVKQAEESALQLLDSISGEEVIKFYTSPAGRAQKTAEVMQKTIQNKINKTNSNVILLPSEPRVREGLRDARFSEAFEKEAQEAGFDRRELLEYWFSQPDIKNIDTPEVVKERLKGAIQKTSRIIERLGKEGPKINIVMITHGEVPSPYLDKYFGTKGIFPAKWIRFDFKAGETSRANISRITKSGGIESKEEAEL